MTVLYEVTDSVAKLTLNRPDRRNAVNDALASDLTEAMRRAGSDDDVRSILLTGAGKGFCAGADINEFERLEKPSDVRDYIVSVYRPLIGLFTSIEKPIIGAINGAAAGAGASLALACDLRVMADDAVLLQAFVNIGLVPDAGATWLLARQVGYSRAYEMAISGEPVSAERCLELGLTNRVVPAADLMEDATAWARKLAAGPTVAYGLTKRAMQQALEIPLGDAIEYEAALQQSTIASEDHEEGVAAFLEKRPPEFEGR